jgi:hypothetical protein
MQVTQGALKILDLPLVVDFLPLGQFEGFKNFFHFVERVLQLLNNPIHLLDSICDRWLSG